MVISLAQATCISLLARDDCVEEGDIQGGPVHPDPPLDVLGCFCCELEMVLIKTKARESVGNFYDLSYVGVQLISPVRVMCTHHSLVDVEGSDEFRDG